MKGFLALCAGFFGVAGVLCSEGSSESAEVERDSEVARGLFMSREEKIKQYVTTAEITKKITGRAVDEICESCQLVSSEYIKKVLPCTGADRSCTSRNRLESGEFREICSLEEDKGTRKKKRKIIKEKFSNVDRFVEICRKVLARKEDTKKLRELIVKKLQDMVRLLKEVDANGGEIDLEIERVYEEVHGVIVPKLREIIEFEIEPALETLRNETRRIEETPEGAEDIALALEKEFQLQQQQTEPVEQARDT